MMLHLDIHDASVTSVETALAHHLAPVTLTGVCARVCVCMCVRACVHPALASVCVSRSGEKRLAAFGIHQARPKAARTCLPPRAQIGQKLWVKIGRGQCGGSASFCVASTSGVQHKR